MLKLKVYLVMGVLGLLFCILVLEPALKHPADGFNKDMEQMTQVDGAQNYKYDSNHPVLSQLPNTAKGAVKGAGIISKFIDFILTVILVLIIFTGVIFFFHLKIQRKEAEERRKRWG